jgi:hypothetical protein
MSRSSRLLEDFPIEGRLTSETGVEVVLVAYQRTRGFIENVERQARLHEAAARGWITLPSQRRRGFAPARMPGRALSELLNEVRD